MVGASLWLDRLAAPTELVREPGARGPVLTWRRPGGPEHGRTPGHSQSDTEADADDPGGVATWERETMLERQREGIAKAKAEGKYKGRPAHIDAAEIK